MDLYDKEHGDERGKAVLQWYNDGQIRFDVDKFASQHEKLKSSIPQLTLVLHPFGWMFKGFVTRRNGMGTE